MKYLYVGEGEYLHGIPKRDLSEADWAALTDEQKKQVATSPLYEPVKHKPLTPKVNKKQEV